MDTSGKRGNHPETSVIRAAHRSGSDPDIRSRSSTTGHSGRTGLRIRFSCPAYQASLPGNVSSIPAAHPPWAAGHGTGTARMLLTLSTTHRPATDLGFLLHKHPD